jgi:phosphate transport system substrate-binding protein
VGYVELQYAEEHGLAVAALKNKAGKFVAPSSDSVAAAASGIQLPPDLRTSIIDADSAKAYPIASLTYLLIKRDAADADKGKALAEFAWWGLHDGQKTAAKLHYAPLPAKVVQAAESRARMLTAQGQPALK